MSQAAGAIVHDARSAVGKNRSNIATTCSKGERCANWRGRDGTHWNAHEDLRDETRDPKGRGSRPLSTRARFMCVPARP
jgi:hypothetical protein